MRHASLVVMALAALGAACQNSAPPVPVASRTTLPDSANQMMFGVRFNLADNGLRRAELFADTAYMYDENTRTELRKVNATFFKQGTGEKDATMTSLQATYNTRLGSMEGRGKVVVISADGRKLETPQLRYDPAKNEISSDSAFVMTEGRRRSEGIGFTSDPDLKTIRVFRNWKASGERVPIPKQ